MKKLFVHLLVLLALALPVRAQTAPAAAAADLPSAGEVQRALRKAVEFFRTKVSTGGGYHFHYSDDLSYGRSESSDSPTQVEVQRDGTPLVGMAYLEVWDATKDRFYLEAARDVAYALVKGQLCSGGWDYHIEFDPEKRKNYPYRADGNCSVRSRYVTNLDDNVTQACARLLMRVDRELGFQDKKIHEASLFALESLLKAQYPNGAWPQRYNQFPDPEKFPVKKASYPESWPRKWPGPNYQSHYTFNDNSISDAIDMMFEAARIYKDPRYLASAEKGGDFILLAQIPEPQPAWAQQYDADMHPAWARVFEPPSVTGGESQGVMKTLLVLYQETRKRKYLDAVPPALDYLQRSALPPVANPSEARRRLRGKVVLARFYELKTNRPLYITKGTRVSVRGGSATLVDGYELSYTDESVITHYGVLTGGDGLEEIAREHKRLAAADPSSLTRAEKLHGLSPWTERPRSPQSAAQLAGSVKTILAAMDERGAWTEEGTIGKSDRIVSLFAAKDMVLKLGDKLMPVRENDTLEVFQGAAPPRERIIVSRTFANNIETLGAYLAALGN